MKKITGIVGSQWGQKGKTRAEEKREKKGGKTGVTKRSAEKQGQIWGVRDEKNVGST